MSLRVIVIDDEAVIGVSIREHLESHGCQVTWVETAKAGLDLLEREQPDVVLLDISLPDALGLDLIPAFTQHPTHPTSVIIITALPDAKNAVQALKQGAWDFLVKPINLDELHEKIRKLGKYISLSLATHQGMPRLSELEPTHPQLRAAIRLAREAARTDQPVCIVGETGTGRQRLAHMIHFASDRARESCLVWTATEDRTRVQEHLATLVGAEPGALNPGSSRVRGQLELVGQGTLIIREVQSLPTTIQQILLQLLRNRTYSPLGGKVRSFSGRLVFTATPTVEEPSRTTVMPELRQMLMGRHIFLPPLRDRQQDFMGLLNELVEELNQEYGKAVKGIEPAAVASLLGHSWQGNVGELKLVLGRLWPRVEESRLTRRMLPPEFQHRSGSRAILPDDVATLAEVEKQHITRVMELCQGNQTQAARALDIARSTLINKLRLYSEGELELQEGDALRHPPSYRA